MYRKLQVTNEYQLGDSSPNTIRSQLKQEVLIHMPTISCSLNVPLLNFLFCFVSLRIFSLQVNNALSFVAAIGNKFSSPQASPASQPPQAASQTRTQSAPSNLCGWSSYGQEGGNSFGVHPWHASITVVKAETSTQVIN